MSSVIWSPHEKRTKTIKSAIALLQESLQKLLKPGLVHKVLQRIPVNVPGHMVTNWLCQSVIPFIVEADPGAVVSEDFKVIR